MEIPLKFFFSRFSSFACCNYFAVYVADSQFKIIHQGDLYWKEVFQIEVTNKTNHNELTKYL